MHEDRYIKVEENVYIDTKGGLTPQQRAWIAKIITYGIGALMTGGLVLMVWSFLDKSHENARRSSCQSNLRQIGYGIIQYLQDYDSYYPSVAVSNTAPPYGWAKPYGWADAIEPYLSTINWYHCPSIVKRQQDTPHQPGYNNYWFNHNLSHAAEKTVVSPGNTFMMGEGLANGDARASLNSFPVNWKDDQSSPLWRHLHGANYTFVDGHVKWLSGATAYSAKDYHFGLKRP